MATNGAHESAPASVQDAVLKASDPVPQDAVAVKGLDFDDFAGRNISVADMVSGMAKMGFQASNIGQAVEVIDEMVGRHRRCRW